MQLFDIDQEIYQCNLCGEMVEKFPQGKTVSIGKNKDIVLLGESPACNGWRKSGIAWYDVNHKLIPSGVVLQKLLSEISLSIEDVCFLEAIKCYLKDKKHLSSCGRNCREYLFKQLEIIQPLFVLSMGDTATKMILNTPYHRFRDVVGQEFVVEDYTVIPIYQYNYSYNN